MTIHWAPAFSLGPLSINWYGLGWVVSFLVARMLVLRWAPRYGLERRQVDDLALWSLGGAFVGARLYFVAQNEPLSYVLQPWRIFMVWEGGLAFFGGLVGAIGAASFAARRSSISFTRAADLFAPAVPIAAAIGRIPCFLAGMDYGTPTTLPWGVVYTHPASYAPNDGVSHDLRNTVRTMIRSIEAVMKAARDPRLPCQQVVELQHQLAVGRREHAAFKPGLS